MVSAKDVTLDKNVLRSVVTAVFLVGECATASKTVTSSSTVAVIPHLTKLGCVFIAGWVLLQ